MIVAVGRRLVQRTHHVLPRQTLHAGGEQARAVLWLDGVRRAAEVVVIVGTAAVERVLRERRRPVAVEQVQVCEVPVTGGTIAPGLGATERDRRTSAQRRRHVTTECRQRGERRRAHRRSRRSRRENCNVIVI